MLLQYRIVVIRKLFLKKSNVVFYLLLILIIFPFIGCKKEAPSEPPALFPDLIEFDSVHVGLYLDDAVWQDCKIKTIDMLIEMGVSYKEINRDTIISKDIQHYSVLIMPGGRPDLYSQNLGSEALNIIRSYVASGGGYIGICGGAYLAAETNVWRGWAGEPRVYYQYSDGLIGIFNGTADGPIEDFAPTYRDVHCKIELVDKYHPIASQLPDTIEYVYDHGPMFLDENIRPSTVIGTAVNGGKTLLLCTQYNHGRVFLTSGHPEFDETEITWKMFENTVKWCSKLDQ
jgi:glutamine amidotransferase-like uncharacterized protein